MAETATATKTRTTNDTWTGNDAWSPTARGLLWGGFGVMIVAHLVMAILDLVIYFDKNPAGMNAAPQGEGARTVFGFIYTLGSLAFVGGLTAAGLLPSRLPMWARVTMLSVAAALLVGFGMMSIGSV